MQKANIKVYPSVCSGCLSCQLICSLRYDGAFNPLKARVIIKSDEISFTDDCIETCHLCANYCAYGALICQ